MLVARPPVATLEHRPTAAQRQAHRDEQRDVALSVIDHYNPGAVVCVGVPFGHTRPQWILPFGGPITVDGSVRRIWADFG